MKRRNSLLWVGSAMLTLVVLAAALAGAISPHGPTEQIYRDFALAPPSIPTQCVHDGGARAKSR